MKMIHLILAVMLTGTAVAQDVSVRSDHPDEYVVVSGDTLWDISGRFLEHPWQWPAIWHANPQIDNPHLIYPGDRVSLVYVDGRPQLQLDRGRPTVRLSPSVRSGGREPLSAIPLDAIDEFIRDAYVLSEEEYDDLGYIVANNEGMTYAAEGERTYARGIPGREGDQYVIVRLSNIYYEVPHLFGDEAPETRRVMASRHGEAVPHANEAPNRVWQKVLQWADKPAKVLGYELWEVSKATVVKAGDPAILEINQGRFEVAAGDHVIPARAIDYDSSFFPRPMDSMPENLRVLALTGADYGVGHYQIVTVNAGSNDGVANGHVFSAFRPGKTIRDEVKYPSGSSWKGAFGRDETKVKLPDEYDGHIMIFRTFDEVSYGMVMDGDRPIREFDILRHPDERL